MHPQDPAKARWLAGSITLLSGLLLFLLLPPLLFAHVEGWSYLEGFYFAFITLSTVGFGDYVIGEKNNPPPPPGRRPPTHLLLACVPLAPAVCQLPWGAPGAQSPEDTGFGRFSLSLWCDRAKATQLQNDNWSLNPAFQTVSHTSGHSAKPENSTGTYYS